MADGVLRFVIIDIEKRRCKVDGIPFSSGRTCANLDVPAFRLDLFEGIFDGIEL